MSEHLDFARVTGIRFTSEAPPNPYASGYGNRIPTRYELCVDGKWSRVHAVCSSNSASYYIGKKPDWVFIHDIDLSEMARAAAQLTGIDKDYIGTPYDICIDGKGTRVPPPRKNKKQSLYTVMFPHGWAS